LRTVLILLKKCIPGIIEWIIFFHLILMLAVLTLPEEKLLLWAWGILVYVLAGTAAGRFLRFRWMQVLAGIAAACLSIPALMSHERNWLSFIYAALLLSVELLAFFRSVKSWRQEWYERLTGRYYAAGFVSFVVSCFFYRYVAVLKPYAGWLAVMGLFQLVMGFFLLNTGTMLREVNKSGRMERIPGIVLRGNRIMVFTVLVLAFVLSFRKQLTDMTKSLARTVVLAIIKVFMLLSSFLESPEQPPINNAPPLPPEIPPAEGSPLINTIFNVLAVILGAAAGILLLIFLYRKTGLWLRKIKEYLKSLFSNWLRRLKSEQAYIDERESLFSLKELAHEAFGGLKRILKINRPEKDRWSDCRNNSDRIRYLYRYFVRESIKKGYLFRRALTPAETLRDICRWRKIHEGSVKNLDEGYNQARYGGLEADDDTVRHLAKEILEERNNP
jgi:hypothetical protein